MNITPAKPEIRKRSRWFEAMVVLIVISFGVLAFLVKTYTFFPLDLYITLAIQQVSNPVFAELMNLLTFAGNTVPGSLVLAAGVLGLLHLRKLNDAFVLIISTSGAVAVSIFFKAVVARPRPDPDLINQIGTFKVADSFPSGHVLFYIGFVGYLLYVSHLYLPKGVVKKIIQMVCLLLIILIGVSRIYLGAHWFSDTIGAYLIGVIWLLIVVHYRRKFVDFPQKKSE
jgi:undecaprenyl-diphosphatase